MDLNKDRDIYIYSWAWRHRIFVRTTLTCLVLTIVIISAKGVSEIFDNPQEMLFICGIFIFLNLTVLPGERKMTKQVIIEGKTVKITQYNKKETSFELSGISKIELLDKKHGFRGFLLDQLVVKVKGGGEFQISVNIHNFKKLCEQLSIADVKKLKEHKPENAYWNNK